MSTFWLIIGILVGLFVIYKLVRYATTVTSVVPQEKRKVVYRWGKFHRVVGPGIVRIYPRLDTIEKTIEVRDHPVSVPVEGIFAYGVPNGFTFNFTCRIDPVTAAAGDKQELTRLVLMRESERQEQLPVKVRDAVVDQVAELQQSMPLPAGANTFDGVVALAPGSERYNLLLQGVADRLEKELPKIGIILNTGQKITIMRRILPDDLISDLQTKRGIDVRGDALMRYVQQLRQGIPDVSPAVLSTILGSIPGVDMSHVSPLLIESSGGNQRLESEIEIHPDGTHQINLHQPAGAQPPATTQPRSTQKPASYKLTPDDLRVLKQVPRNDTPRKKSA